MIFHQLKTLLNSRTASVICLLLACLGRVIHLLTSFTFETDRSLQLQAARNFYEGNGISLHQVNPEDLSQFEYAPLINWPPLYSILVSPFNMLGESGFLIGAVVVDLFCCLVFVLLARNIYSLLESERWKLNLYTLVTGFSFYSFAQGRSTDLLALLFILGGCLLTVRCLQKNEFPSSRIFFIILFLWLSGYTRYLSIPLSFCIPALLFLYGYHLRNNAFKRPALIIAGTLALLFSLQYLLQSSLGGSGIYLNPSGRGFNPEQLLHTGPVLFASAGNLEPLALLSEKHFGLSLPVIQQVFIYLNLLLLGLLIPWGAYRLFQRRFGEGPIIPFNILALLFTVFTVLVLGFLSITQRPQQNWTYVSELRYYAASIFFIQLCLFHFIFKMRNKGSLRILRLFAGVVMLASALHGFLFTTKAVFTNPSSLDPRNALASFDNTLNTIINSPSPNQTIIFSNEPALTSYASLQLGIPGSYRDIDSTRTTKPVTVLVAYRKSFGPGNLKNFILFEKNKISENEHWIFYKKEILPNP